MATKEKPLTEKQQVMLAKLKDYTIKKPYMPASASERSSCEALQRRHLCDSILSMASMTIRGGDRSAEFKLAYFIG